MTEYEMPIEEQVKSIAKELRALSETMRTGFGAIDTQFDAVTRRFDGVNKQFDAVNTQFDRVDKQFDAVNTRFDAVDARLNKLQVIGEETKAIAKLGLEGIEALRESTDAKFVEAATASSEQTKLLKSVVVDVRKRVDAIDHPPLRRAKTRGRRS